MSKEAVLWIRDGVLINRMHINAVAFAASVWVFVPPERRKTTTVEMLVNFGFEKSGVSCAEKMRLYNDERENVLDDIDQAASFYNELATSAAARACYFAGTPQLLESVSNSGAANFITSAVEQDILENWAHSTQATLILPHLREILGSRPGFSKGRDHFEYVSRQGYDKIYMIADAPSEIRCASEFSAAFNIVPVGFANLITIDNVMSAVEIVTNALIPLAQQKAPILVRKLRVDPARITMPDSNEVEAALRGAGARYVVSGTTERIMFNLRDYFAQEGLI